MSRYTVVRNGFFNVLRGGGGAVVALVLPFAIARLYPPEMFIAWTLAWQTAAILVYFEFGVQTAVAREVAMLSASCENPDFHEIVSNAMVLLAISALVGWLVLALACLALPTIFPKLNGDSGFDAQLAMLGLISVSAIALPMNTFVGVLAGLQRNGFASIVVAIGKILAGTVAVLAGFFGFGIAVVSLVFAITNFFALCVVWQYCVRHYPNSTFRSDRFSWIGMKKIGAFCASLSVWAVAMLLINGLATAIVARYDYDSTAPFGSALTLVSFLAGFVQAAFSALLPVVAAQFAKNAEHEMANLLIKATQIAVSGMLLFGSALWVLAPNLMMLWLGEGYGESGGRILRILVLAYSFRLVLVPYATMIVGSGDQTKVIATPMIEGAITFLASLCGGVYAGAVGVAIGMAISSASMVFVTVFINFPKIQSLRSIRRRFFLHAMAAPALIVSSILTMLLLIGYRTIPYF